MDTGSGVDTNRCGSCLWEGVVNNGLASGNMGLEGRGEKARRQKHEGGTKYCTGARSPPGLQASGPVLFLWLLVLP